MIAAPSPDSAAIPLLDDARALLRSAPGNSSAAFRYPVLATPDGAGGADARILVLRSFDLDTWHAGLFTDRRSPKMGEIENPGPGALVFYDHGAALQVRMRGNLVQTADTAARDAAWRALPDSNRRNYRTTEPPGFPLPAPGDGLGGLTDTDAFDNFAMLTFLTESVDILRLSATGNRRYRFAPATGTGSWLVP